MTSSTISPTTLSQRAVRNTRIAPFADLLELEGGTVRAGAVARRLGTSPMMVEQLRQRGHVLAVPLSNGYAYPAWQFDGRSILSGLSAVIRALGQQDSWATLEYFLTPSPSLGGERPLDALRRGASDTVVAAIHAEQHAMN